MSFRGTGKRPPKGYVPGLGRGAAGFTTQSDLGSMMPAAGAAGGSQGGSRAAEARAAKMQAQKMQNQGPAGAAPKGYVAGAGRGASSFGGGGIEALNSVQQRRAAGDNRDSAPAATTVTSAAPGQYDDDDNEADMVWAAVDERMSKKRKRQQEAGATSSEDAGKDARAKIGAQFRELKEGLSSVTEDQWASIPDVGDYSLRYKQKQKEDVFTPLSDTILEQRSSINLDASSGALKSVSSTAAASEAVTNMSGLGAARETVLGMSLDKMSDTMGGQTVVDPQGYLTSLSSSKIASTAEVGDINKARLLLKSVRDTNPKHAPGWIASARVEEAAGKTLQARKVIQQGCNVCPDSEDVWLEAARLHPQEVAKSILATGARRIPTSVKIFLKAADLESNETSKKAVLRKALEANPTSITLWKAAIDLEDAENAKILLSVAVDKVPHSVEMWLALARLESYENARKVLNKARRALPGDRAVWIAAAKLEESQNHNDMVDKVVDRAMQSLAKRDTVVTRAQWLQEAEAAESSGAPITSGAIVKHSIGMGVEEEDRFRTWADDAKASLSRGAIVTARAILTHALSILPRKHSLWMQAVDLERKHGTAETLDDILAAASERLPSIEIFWLLRAKEQWVNGNVDKARDILTKAFAVNPNSESVWLAAAKLEWETGETERARVLLSRARDHAPTNRVYMKSALLERENKKFKAALKLIHQGISEYPKFPKLYMMGAQIWSEDMPKDKKSLEHARKILEVGLQECPKNHVLWILTSKLEAKAHTFDSRNNGSSKAGTSVTKARSLLELARLKNSKVPELWLEAVRLERRTGNSKLAESVMARALQECPKAGILLAENIAMAPRVEQKSKSVDAIKRSPEDPLVITAVASLFVTERKYSKARKWFERAVTLNPDLGDAWARYYNFERDNGSDDQVEAVKTRCAAAEPKHGEVWASTMKQMKNRQKSMAEGLELVAKTMREA